MNIHECPRCWKPLIFKGTTWKNNKSYGSYVCPECFTWMDFEMDSSTTFSVNDVKVQSA